MGVVEVLVPADELEVAQELLLADEVESAFAAADDDVEEAAARRTLPRWAVACVVVVLVVSGVSELLSPR
jgi:hypothetical protein